MATLVLSTVGTALAGPIGGMLGSLVGQSIDQQLLGGGPRKGPRLGDLSVQTSSYGTPIPRIYGRMRVAGTVIWATDLRESSELQGDGKSQPETVVYTYRASFAVALSSRQASQVGRIWADGRLLRGAAGDMKVPGTFRFHPGSQSQPVDPLIEMEEGIGNAPAYRGLALAVFEDLQLGEFGNRIPTLTFELIADEGEGVQIDDLLADSSSSAIQPDDSRTVIGYAAHGEDSATAIAPLVEAFAIELHDDGEALRTPGSAVVIEPDEQQLGASADLTPAPRAERNHAAAGTLPSALTVSYYDAARDYQAGQARASLPAQVRTVRALGLPCVLQSGQAKTLAENLLVRAWALRETISVHLPPVFLGIRPGELVRLPGVAGDWTVEDVEIERFVVAARLRPAWARAGVRTADPGRPVMQLDIIAAPTRLALFDLPNPETYKPALALVAASPSGNWSPVPIEIAVGDTVWASRTAIGEATLGTVLTPLGPGQPWFFDAVAAIEVQLANPDQWLQSRDNAALAMGANLAMVGDELIQFGQADALAPSRFRLSKLLRGRGGSEWAMRTHVAGEDFALIEQRSVKTIPVPLELLGAPLTVTARGAGDAIVPPSVSRVANGEGLRPLSPAHLAARKTVDGSLEITWIRRSRLAWHWSDEIEAPADEAVHGFRVSVIGTDGALERDVSDTQAVISQAELAALGGAALAVDVRQVGAVALSRPATVSINI